MKIILFWIWVLAMAAAPCRASTTFIITSELEGDINAPWFILPGEDGDNGASSDLCP